MSRSGLILMAILLGGLAPTRAAPPADPTLARIQAAELARLRFEVAGQIQIAAAHLLDELVYGWTQAPPFAQATPVVLVSLTVPVGLGTGLQAALEDHLAALTLANPGAHVTLAACPSCTAMLVHAGPAGTVISRGADNPEALEKLGGAGARHALYLDVAAEGAWLVLRARITRLTPDLPILWSKTLSAAAGAPSLLRHPEQLKSPLAARQEYLDALAGRGPFTIPARFAVRAYAPNDFGIAAAPSVWLQTGFEAALSQAQKWKASAVLGAAWLPEAYHGFMAQSRFARLISGPTRSLTGPDVYLFLGGALITLSGPAIAQIANQTGGQRATYGAFQLGLELRLGERIGAAVFIENMPTYDNPDQIGTWVRNGLMDLHALGFEVALCF